MSHETIKQNVATYYTSRLEEHGPSARGVDWNGADSQHLRHEQLLRIVDQPDRFSINDFGCGYGALREYLDERQVACDYCGFDLAPAMVAAGQARFTDRPDARFVGTLADLAVADYTVASGVFNVRLEHDDESWLGYMHETVAQLAEHSRRGFAFNALTKYSDPPKMRPDLYYADPLYWFDYCKRHYARRVALLHDYPLYEFTLLVRKVVD